MAAHIFMILAVSVAYFSQVISSRTSARSRSYGAYVILDSTLSLMMSAIITNIIQEINYSRELEAEAQEEWQTNKASFVSSINDHDLTFEDALLERKYI